MALPPTNPPGLVRDAEDLNKVVNGDGTTNRAGDSLPSIKAILGVVEDRRDSAVLAIQQAESDVQGALDDAVNRIITEGEQAAASTGWFVIGDFADGFEFTARNQVGRDADGELWSYNGEALPFTVAAGTIPSDPTYTNRGDAALRSEIAADGGAQLVAGGVPIYRQSYQSLLSISGSELTDGQIAKVRSTEFVWSGGQWKPVSNIYANAFGARGDCISRTNISGATNSRQAFIDAANFAVDNGHKYVYAEPGIYHTPDLLPQEMQDLYIVGDGVLFASGGGGPQDGFARVIALSSIEQAQGVAYNSNKQGTKGAIAFELDDSQSSDFTRTLPLFKEYGLAFGIAFHTGSDRPWLREAWRHGAEIMAHFPDNIAADTLTREQLVANAESDIATISAITGRDDNINFVYPMHRRNDETDDVLSQYYYSGRGVFSSAVINKDQQTSWLCAAFLIDSGLQAGNLDDIKARIRDVALNDGKLVFYAHNLNQTMADNLRIVIEYALSWGVAIVPPMLIKKPSRDEAERYFANQDRFTLTGNAQWDESVSSPNGTKSVRLLDEGTGFSSANIRFVKEIFPASQKDFAHYRMSFLYKSDSEIVASSTTNFGIGVGFNYNFGSSVGGSSGSGTQAVTYTFSSLPAADFDNRIIIDIYIPRNVSTINFLGITAANIAAPYDINIDDFRLIKVGELDSVCRKIEIGKIADFAVLGQADFGGESLTNAVVSVNEPTDGSITNTIVTSRLVLTSSESSDNGKSATVVYSLNRSFST